MNLIQVFFHFRNPIPICTFSTDDRTSGSDVMAPSEDGTDDNTSIHISLMPSSGDILSQSDSGLRPSSLIETESDCMPFSQSRGSGTQSRRSSSPCLSSSEEEDEEDMEDEDEDEGAAEDNADCLSDGSKRERVIQNQIESSLTPEVAQHSYVALCRLIGQETLRRYALNIIIQTNTQREMFKIVFFSTLVQKAIRSL